jgi:hypothetical protein
VSFTLQNYQFRDERPYIRPKALKLVNEGVGNTQDLIDIGNSFLNRTPMAQQLRERIEKWGSMKLKSFCTRSGL